MKILSIDIGTFYSLNLKNVVYKYAEHEEMRNRISEMQQFLVEQ